MLCVKNNAKIKCTIDELVPAIDLDEHKFKYDVNYAQGGLIKKISDDCDIRYLRTKKVAVVSSRDLYMLTHNIYTDNPPSKLGYFKV